ncbi:hypothetical protein JOQ06_013816 [Pogonophryne albipinna]|uniref:Uncharacterized protein n=1 Tax=Pogonophryne albipinna TaxID=1090488 RepID=A0AAD6FRN7_9TELE|nr:hypothetical protein JOQ06_013816 [Pogonophryne albipinna]
MYVQMDGEASPMSGGSQRADKRSYKDLKIDVEEMEEHYLDFEESSNKKLHEEPGGLINKICKHSVCMSGDRWEKRGEEASPISLLEYWVYPDNQHHRALCPVSRTIAPVTHRPRPVISALSPVTAIAPKVSSVVNPMVSSPVTDTCSPSSSMCSPTSSAWDSLRSTSRSPGCSDQDPVSAAAHLHLLGESLSLIGLHLQETNKHMTITIHDVSLLTAMIMERSQHVPVYHPNPGESRSAYQLTEEEQVRIAQRIGLIHHLPKGIFNPGSDPTDKKVKEGV